MGMFLGEGFEFWIELKEARTMGELDLVRENAKLRAKVGQYEHHLDLMAKYRDNIDSVLGKKT